MASWVVADAGQVRLAMGQKLDPDIIAAQNAVTTSQINALQTMINSYYAGTLALNVQVLQALAW